MAESTLRENRRGATQQNATTVNQARMRVLVQQAFYQHESLGPGAPLREITGEGEGNGYYDWAGRRLFLVDGEPDPMCPGAYRYQHNPACCDLEAPDSDPRSPRYEPMHLRHRPGDTWIIDTNRPHDPFDPGPFGSPGWYKDERTGRHRRDESHDPLPAEGWVPPKGAWFPGTADWPEPRAAQDDQARAAEQRKRDDGQGERGGADRPPPWGSRGRPVPTEPDEPSSNHASTDRGGADRPPPLGSRGRPVPSEPEEPAQPEPRKRFWQGDDDDPHGGSGRYRSPGDRGWMSGACDTPSSGDDLEDEDPQAYRFSKLREDAFDRFMANSAQLRAAHFQPERPYLRERAASALRWLLWVLACGLAPMPARLTTRQRGPEPAAAQSIPAQPGPTPPAESTPTRTDNAIGKQRAEHPAATPGVAGAPETPRAAARPGAALAAAINGARAARNVARESRTRDELATAVRNSVNRTRRSNLAEPGAGYWRAQPRQTRPRPSPRPHPASYMSAWEQAFDNTAKIIRVTNGGIGAAA
jgi:hypothetical protein